MEATSLQPYFNDTPAPERHRIYAEHSNDALLTGTRLMTMIRDRAMKLVHVVDADKGLLFNLDADPKEQTNLWDDPSHAKTRDWLIDEILNWRSESSLKTQGFTEACVRGAQTMMSPPMKIARGQHRDGSR
jgi:arylsulfatase A-like enzyme